MQKPGDKGKRSSLRREDQPLLLAPMTGGLRQRKSHREGRFPLSKKERKQLAMLVISSFHVILVVDHFRGEDIQYRGRWILGLLRLQVF